MCEYAYITTRDGHSLYYSIIENVVMLDLFNEPIYLRKYS